MATSKNYGKKKVRITSGIFWTLMGKNPIMEKSERRQVDADADGEGMVTAVKWWVKRKGKWGYDWYQQWEEWG